jgi:excisionase family DNA binding protein
MTINPAPNWRGIEQGRNWETESSKPEGFDVQHTPLLDIQGVAAWLGTSHRHVRRLVAERRIPYVKVGHFVRFNDVEVAEWIAKQQVSSLES